MNATLMRMSAIALACLIATEAGAQMEGCALALGRTPDNQLAFQPVPSMPTQQEALNRAAGSFQRPGYQYVNAASAVNSAVAAVIYTHVAGAEVQQFSTDSTAYGAIHNVLDAAGRLHDKRRAPYVKWVRCSTSPPLTRKQLAQLTWGNNLTAVYGGYQAQIQEFVEPGGVYGGFYMMPTAGTAPPNPTPAPPGWGSGTPVGCWQRFDHLNRPDGNSINILPATRSDGSQVYDGRHIALSPVQLSAGRQLNRVGLTLIPAPTARPPENYRGSYEFVNGNWRSDGFVVTADTISGGTSAIATEKFTWRRINCPPR